MLVAYNQECHTVQVADIKDGRVIFCIKFFGSGCWIEDFTIKQITEIEHMINCILDKIYGNN